MRKEIVIIAKILVKILEKLLFFLQIEPNKITYISYASNKLNTSFREISKELKKINPNCIETYILMEYKNTIIDNLKYVIHMVKQLYHIKKSKVVLLDGNNFVLSNINKKNITVIQIWHASGCIKKFGRDYKRKYEISKYDYVITASSTSKPFMASAFGIDESRILPLGYIPVDKLFNQHRVENIKKEMFEKYPYVKGKKVILYAPTFRGNAIYEKKYLNVNFEKIMSILGDEYVILYKLHPIIKNDKKIVAKNVYDVSNESVYKLFTISDILISDFSSIIFDFTILEKPILLYVPDLEEYEKERGLYYDYIKFAPGKVLYTEEELAKAIINREFNLDKVKKLKDEFFDYKDGKTASRVANLINNILKTLNTTNFRSLDN